MNGKRALILLLTLLFTGHLAVYYPRLPEKMATHFNYLGEPDGWMPKNSFYLFVIGLMVFMVGLFYSLSFIIPKFPDQLINIPNREYWLAPERRAEAFRRLRDEMETFVIPVILLLTCINHLAFRANLYRENLSAVSWVLVGGFLLYTLIWSIGLYRKFKVYEN